MRNVFTRRRVAVAAAAAALVVGAGTALAWWSSNGTGTGSATTGTADANEFTVTQVNTLTAMYPGDSAQGLQFTIKNNDSTQSLHVAHVSVAVTDVTKGGSSIFGSCDATNFTIVQPTDAAVAQDLGAGITSATISSGSIHFHDLASNQDACQGASVVLTYTAS